MLEEGLFALFQTTEGDILVRLEMEKAPMTVGNFVALAEGKMPNGVKEDNSFYDSTIFHRVIPDFDSGEIHKEPPRRTGLSVSR